MLRQGIGLALASVALLLAGCAKPAGVVFEPLGRPLVWPAPPDDPRIHYVGQLATSADLKPARRFGESIAQAIFGKQPDHSLIGPMAVTTDGADRIFIADSAARLIHVFDLDTRRYEQWQPPEPHTFSLPVGIVYASTSQAGAAALCSPGSPAATASDRLYVSDSAAGVIWGFRPDGTYDGMIGDDDIIRPTGLAWHASTGRLFVADTAAHQIVVLDHAGVLVARIGQRGDALGQFNFPTDVALDAQGRLYVSDSLNCRVQQFAPDLTPIRQIGRQGDMPGYFSRPKGIAVDSEGHLYAVDSLFEAVQIFNDEGALLLAFGQEGRGPGEFWLPSGLHIDPTDRIWVADSYNRRVQVFQYRPLEIGTTDEHR